MKSEQSLRSFSQLVILIILAEASRRSIAEIARLTGQFPEATRHSLKPMLSRGLVERGTFGWRITDGGRAELAEQMARREQEVRWLMSYGNEGWM